jgi:hypothetical protein
MSSLQNEIGKLARAKAIEDAIIYVEYLNKNFSLNLRKRPSDIISIAREFTEFIEEE